MRRSRYAALILLLVILAGTILPCYSQAVVAEAILITGVVSVTLGLVLDLLTVCMGSSAMDGALRNQARSMSISPRQRLAQIYSDWRDARDKTMDDVAAIVQRGLHYGDNGDLYLDAELADTVTDVLGYAWTEQDLEGYAPVGAADGLLTDGTHDVALLTFGDELTSSSGVNPVYVESDAYLYTKFSDYYRHFYIGSVDPSTQWYAYLTVTDNGGTGSSLNVFYTMYLSPVNSYARRAVEVHTNASEGTYYSVGRVVSSPVGSWVSQSVMKDSATDSGVSGSISLPLYSSQITVDFDALQAVSDVIGDPSHLDTGTGVQLQISQAATLTTDVVDPDTRQRILVNNWISAIARYYDQVAGTAADGATVGEAVEIPVYDDTGEQIGVGSLSIPLDTAVPVTGVSDATISQDATAATDVVAADQAGLDDLTLDLTAYFPFCVPFDIYRIFAMWDATAEAPVIEWRVLVPQLNVDLPLTIDLSPFDDVAALLRQLEVIAFAVGLAVMTKRLIQGGD